RHIVFYILSEVCSLAFQQCEAYHIEIMELLAKLMNNSSKTSTVQTKRIKPSIIYRLLLMGLGTPMVIYGLVCPLTIETRD
ncbi:TPA: hypothetical protein ACG7L5_004903, partial [Escherichia coli]